MSRFPEPQARSEGGSGTLLALSAMLLLLSVGLVGALWAVVSLGHHRAVAAADLAALSAAHALRAGRDACGTATEIAGRHHAEVLSCDVAGDTVEVVASVTLRLGALGEPEVRSTARAGPTVGPAGPTVGP